jgi:hypothetical protein
MAELPLRTRKLFWKNLEDAWPTPASFLRDGARLHRLTALGRGELTASLTTMAELMSRRRAIRPEELLFVGARKASLAFALCGYAYSRPDFPAVSRLARRYFGSLGKEDAAGRQIMIAMLIGSDTNGQAFSSLLEIGERICTLKNPACLLCPLREECASADLTGRSSTAEKSFSDTALRTAAGQS